MSKENKSYTIVPLCERRDMAERAAEWYHGKWGIPLEAYTESIEASFLHEAGSVPSWYVALDENERIIGGVGMIENDFHRRPDLTPNVCALYVEKDMRNNGIAHSLLDRAREDAGRAGIEKLYLITDHIGFYEKCGWEYLFDIEENSGDTARMYCADTIRSGEA